jgi:hypothetical protein
MERIAVLIAAGDEYRAEAEPSIGNEWQSIAEESIRCHKS